MLNSMTSHLILYGVFLSANCLAEITNQPDTSTHVIDQNTLSEAFKDNVALTRYQLDRQRGGFIDKSGFKISIGFEKVVVVNGKLEAKSKFYIPTLNLTNRNKNEVKELALAMDALRDRLNSEDYKGSHSKSELTGISDNIDNLAGTINDSLSDAQSQQDTLNLTTAQKNGEGQYTDALLSMLNGSQSLINTATPKGHFPDNMTTVVMNSQDSSLIQSFQMLNIKIDNLGQYRSRSINALMLPQIIHSLR